MTNVIISYRVMGGWVLVGQFNYCLFTMLSQIGAELIQYDQQLAKRLRERRRYIPIVDMINTANDNNLNLSISLSFLYLHNYKAASH